MPVLVVFSNFPNPELAAQVARTLVSENLAACVNLVGPVRSVYRWEGKLCDDTETLAIIKTTTERFDAMKERLVSLHEYKVPEVVAMSVEAGHAPYLAWVADETKS